MFLRVIYSFHKCETLQCYLCLRKVVGLHLNLERLNSLLGLRLKHARNPVESRSGIFQEQVLVDFFDHIFIHLYLHITVLRQNRIQFEVCRTPTIPLKSHDHHICKKKI